MTPKSIALAVMTAFALATAPASAQEVVKVGSTPTGVPFTFLDTKTNTMQGAMVDLIQAVGKEAGFQAEIQPMAFSALIGSLNSKRIDVIAAAMFITPPRQEVVAFTKPVYSYGEALMVPTSDTASYADMQSLKGKTVGVQIGTAFVEPVQKSGLFKEVKLYDNPPDMMRDANAGRIQAAFMDYPIAANTLLQGNYPNLRIVKEYKPTVVGHVGIATRKDDPELLARIDKAVAALDASGEKARILKKWGME